jgi:nicotinate-nucleotide pyrophosphorylase (carboxylating)
MSFSAAEAAACEHLAKLALQEDLGQTGRSAAFAPGMDAGSGDLTSQAVIPADCGGQAVFVNRTAGVVAGLPAAQIVFALVDPALSFEQLVQDGSKLEAGTRLAIVRGPMRSLLTGERTALNFMQRLSGIATLTARYVALVAGLSCKVLDTRKTTPGWRLLEKYAVRMGGGHNHRMGLNDGILIKDNHLAALGSTSGTVGEAVRLARQKHGTAVPLEIEVDNLEQLDAALAVRPDIVLLDNMPPEQLCEAVRRRNAVAPGVLLEASGGVTFATLRAIAESGVDRVSIGALTHSATALDIGLDYLP